VANNAEADRELRVTYLWQNNYARKTTGEPIDVDGLSIADLPTAQPGEQKAIRPEADVVKVDYSTRSVINITLGARVYDSSTGQPQLIQVRDKVQVNNVGR